jgi:aspartate/methionine/tyrosine aminotransferase
MNPFDYAHKHSKDIVWMSQNTNQLPTSPELEEAMLQAVKEGVYSLYPRAKGIFDLCETVSAHLGLPDDYRVLLTNGGIEGLYALNRAMLSAGDEVICTDPSFMPIHHQIDISEGRPVELPIYGPPWKLTRDQIMDAINPRTKMLLLIDSINPLGTAYTRDEIKAICDVIEANELVIIDDITYRDFSEPVGTYEYIPDRTFVSYTFSKNCGLAGMRIGCLAGPPKLMEKIMPFNTNVLSVNVIAQRAALAAMRTINSWLPGLRAQLLKNQEIIKAAVHEVEGTFLPVFPSKTNMFCIDISATGVNPDDVENKLLFDHNVFVRSGNYVSKRFGNKFIRTSFSVPQEGCERFAEAFPKVMDELRK